MKISVWLCLPAMLFVLVSCSGSGGSASGERSEPAKSEKSVRESAEDYLMNPVRQKRQAVSELNKTLGAREKEIARQLDEASQR